MLYQKEGDRFTVDGITFTVGGKVFANKNSEFTGLFGTVTEIRTGNDREETYSDTPDIHCCFEPPEDQDLIYAYERRFSELYQTPKKLDEIGLDCVIMAPSMLEPIPNVTLKTAGSVYTLIRYTDSDDSCSYGVMGVSTDVGVLLRRMLDDLKTQGKEVILTHSAEANGDFSFIYEARETGAEDLFLNYIISASDILPCTYVWRCEEHVPYRETEMEERPEIKADDITECLFARYICSYLLYDYNLDHANNCFYNNEHQRTLRALEKAKTLTRNGRSWEEQLTWAYNQVLAEDIEKLIECNCGENMSRAEYEVLLAEMISEYNTWPCYGRKEEA